MAITALINRIEAWRNRGLTHVFLGHAGSAAADKTTVEPGGAFSPGVWTCGVNVWIDAGAGWICSEDLPADDVEWKFIEHPGGPPEIVSRWSSAGVWVEHRVGHFGKDGCTGLDAVTVSLSSEMTMNIQLAVAITGVGPAGGKLHRLEWDAALRRFTTEDGIAIIIESEVEGTVVKGPTGPLGAAMLTRMIGPDRSGRLDIRVRHAFASRAFANHWQAPQVPDLTVEAVRPRIAAAWDADLPARMWGPDPRIALGWERCAYHILAAMEHGRPRIGAVNYPIFWIRDGVLILRALDIIGRSDLARIGCDELAPMVFGGGFGAEADAPGEGIWALVSHARLSGDYAWLERRFPAIVERVEWIQRMRTTTTPLFALSENRLPGYLSSPGAALVCLASRHGLVQGRMDWHQPEFYINCWCQAGLREAAVAARHLGRTSEAEVWAHEAAELDARIVEHLLPRYGNPRDPACTPHPCGALAGHRKAVRDHCFAWLHSQRLEANGQRRPEQLWTYFEAAQAHNSLLLGLHDEAWTLLNGLLGADGPRDAAAFIEGKSTGNEFLPFRNDAQANGWLDRTRALGGNMPHNWTCAEIVLALRDVFVCDNDGNLVIGAGVPQSWLRPGAHFGCRGIPTMQGPVSWQATVRNDGSIDFNYEGPHPYTTAFRAPH